MKYLVVLIFMMCTLSLYAQDKSNKTDLIKNAIIDELKIYPEEHLADLYKSFFQGYWGPGHIIADSASALNYLADELKSMKKADTLLIHELGYYNKFVRVNLLLVKDERVPFTEFANTFLRSVNKNKLNSIDEWKSEWSLVLKVIEEMNLQFAGYEDDKTKIDELLKQGKYMLHHSDFFVNKYFPHYRVISVEEFERLKRQYLEEQ